MVEPARLASKQAASKQLAPQGRFLAPEQQGSQNRGKNVAPLLGMVFRNFLGNNFLLVGPPPAGNSDLGLFWPGLPLGT